MPELKKKSDLCGRAGICGRVSIGHYWGMGSDGNRASWGLLISLTLTAWNPYNTGYLSRCKTDITGAFIIHECVMTCCHCTVPNVT